MTDDAYTLGDIARLADVTPRTVRYYVAQGLLPSPEPAGPATRYGAGHLARLRLIRRLQQDHLPLAEIRQRLERMGDEDVIAIVRALTADEPEPSRAPGDTLAYVRSLMSRSGVQASVSDQRPGGVRLARTRMADSLDEAWAAPDPAPTRAPDPAPTRPPAPAAPASSSPASSATRVPVPRSTWERLVIAPDVELHVRRPLDRTTNKRVGQLERIARELFEQE